jgi:hypothetical protein
MLSEVVDDWKLKLEWIVAEGLKKMRRCQCYKFVNILATNIGILCSPKIKA